MSKLRSLPYAVLAVSLLTAGGASAQSMWSIDQREASQQDRINDGRRDGSLTRSEASRLQQGENRINRYEARAKADGVVTSGERQRLDSMLDRENRAIHNERTDGQRAYNHNGDRDGRGGHGGWDNNRGNHNGWDQASANRNNWGDHDQHQRGDMNRPDHSGFNGHNPVNGQPPASTHTGWMHNQPPATTPPTTTPPTAHTGWNGGSRGQQQGTTPQANTRPAPTSNNQPRMVQASAPAPRQAYTPSSGGRR